MQANLRAQIIQAFAKYLSADGTSGVTNSTGGLIFKNGLYVGGTVSAVSTSLAPDSITIMGTGGNGYILFSAQTSTPALGGANVYATSAGRIALGHSGTTAYSIIFGNDALTANHTLTAPNKDGTLAMVGDNVSEFANDAGYVVQTRTITEGAGLAGNTYDLSVNRTLAMGTPTTLTVATGNSASGTTHSHAITSSADPGAAAAILATDASGFLRLVRLGIGVAPTQPLHVAGNAFLDAVTANLYMKDTSTGLQVSATGVINPQSGNAFRTTSFTSGVVGWNVSNDGSAEFNNVRIRGELAASVFKISEISATGGTFGVFYSAATLSQDFTTPASYGGVGATLFFAKKSDAGAATLSVGDIVRIKTWTGSGIGDAWITLTGRDTVSYGSQVLYQGTLNSGSTSTTFRAGTAVIDYGPSGTGYITLSTDGTVGSSPNMTMATHAGSPWSAQTNLLRLGNLNGSYGYGSDVYGLGIGQYGAAQPWFTFDTTNGIRIGNNTTVLGQWDTAGNATFGQVATNKANVYWNTSNQRLEFRGSTSGTVVQSYIDTDGSFTAGGGKTVLNASGLSLAVSSGTSFGGDTGTSITWGALGAIFTDNVHELHLNAIGASSLSAFSTVTMQATEYGGARKATFSLKNTTSDNYAVLFAGAGTFTGLTVGSNSVPTHMLDIYGTGFFQSGIVTPDSNSQNPALDSSTGTVMTVANNAVGTPYGSSDTTIRGLLIISGKTVDGAVGVFVISVNTITQLAGGTAWSVTKDNAGTANVYRDGTSGVLSVQNKRGASETFSIIAFKI